MRICICCGTKILDGENYLQHEVFKDCVFCEWCFQNIEYENDIMRED